MSTLDEIKAKQKELERMIRDLEDNDGVEIYKRCTGGRKICFKGECGEMITLNLHTDNHNFFEIIMGTDVTANAFIPLKATLAIYRNLGEQLRETGLISDVKEAQ